MAVIEQVVTSFSVAGARLYGRRMVESFVRFWPAETPLVAYLDAAVTPPLPVVTRSTMALPDWATCRARWAEDRAVQGQSTREYPRPKPYHYKWDAARFAVKVFVWRDAALRLGRGILTWLDGDTVTERSVPAGFTAALLGDADVAYLGRGSMHPENGYVGFRIPEALPLLEWCCGTYTTERFRGLNGWTDCHVLRAGLEAVPVRARDLTSRFYEGKSHIWPVSPLARYLTHHKGRTKRDARRKRQVVGR